MKEAQAAMAKAGQERLPKVLCRTISVNMGLKMPCTATPKLSIVEPESGLTPGPPVTMYVSMPVMMTIQIQIKKPMVNPSAMCRFLLSTL
jgi:hypothetical protein